MAQYLTVRKSKEKRTWKVVEDPSGDFLGNLFRNMDIRFSLPIWPEGLKMRHTVTGEILVWDRGKFVHKHKEQA